MVKVDDGIFKGLNVESLGHALKIFVFYPNLPTVITGTVNKCFSNTWLEQWAS